MEEQQEYTVRVPESFLLTLAAHAADMNDTSAASIGAWAANQCKTFGLSDSLAERESARSLSESRLAQIEERIKELTARNSLENIRNEIQGMRNRLNGGRPITYPEKDMRREAR